jgi:hypothetical protein
MESLVNDIPAGDGKINNLFYSVGIMAFHSTNNRKCLAQTESKRSKGFVVFVLPILDGGRFM